MFLKTVERITLSTPVAPDLYNLPLKILCRPNNIFCAVQVMRHGVGLSTSSDSELITQLLALTPPMEELDSPDWVARQVLRLDAA